MAPDCPGEGYARLPHVSSVRVHLQSAYGHSGVGGAVEVLCSKTLPIDGGGVIFLVLAWANSPASCCRGQKTSGRHAFVQDRSRKPVAAVEAHEIGTRRGEGGCSKGSEAQEADKERGLLADC